MVGSALCPVGAVQLLSTAPLCWPRSTVQDYVTEPFFKNSPSNNVAQHFSSNHLFSTMQNHRIYIHRTVFFLLKFKLNKMFCSCGELYIMHVLFTCTAALSLTQS